MPMTEPVLSRAHPHAPVGRSRRSVARVDYDAYVATGGYEALEKALSMKPEQIVEMVKESQLRGRGGAGFPCGLKWTFLPEPDGGRRYLAVNCDEAEPGTFKDRLLVDFDPHLMLEGIAITCYACRLDTAYFFIRGEYRHQAKVMERAIEEAYENRHLRQAGAAQGQERRSRSSATCTAAPARTSAARRRACSSAIEGKRAGRASSRPSPPSRGSSADPTIVNNVETLAAVGPIVENGVEWWTSMGCASSIGGPPSFGPKLMGVSGHVNRPGVYEVDLGIPLREARRRVLRRHARRQEVQGRDRRRRLAWASSVPTSSTRRWTSTSAASTT